MRYTVLTAYLGLVVCAACGDDTGVEDGELVGGPCSSNADCEDESRCLDGGSFPQGTCALPCSDHDDCPSDTRCIEKEGGVCLIQCVDPADCRGGYTCKGVKNESGGGESLVCIH